MSHMRTTHRANVTNYIIIDIFYLLWKPPNLSCIFDIIFVVQYVLAFDESQIKFITLITRAHTQRRTNGPQYSTVFLSIIFGAILQKVYGPMGVKSLMTKAKRDVQ